MSFAFTFTESTSRFTRDTSPFRQASNSSLKAPPMPLLPSVGLAAPEPGLETLLLPPPDAVVVKLALLASAGAGRSGEARGTSIPPLHSLSPSGGPTAEVSRAIGGEAGGAPEIEPFLGGDCKVFCCCCCCEERRGTAITAALGDNKSCSAFPVKVVELPVSCSLRGGEHCGALIYRDRKNIFICQLSEL